MLHAIVDLTVARPHPGNFVNRSPALYRAYCQGYYTGVVMALRVADLAVENFKAVTKTRRAGRHTKRSA